MVEEKTVDAGEQDADQSTEESQEAPSTTEEVVEETIDWAVRGPELQAALDQARNNEKARAGDTRKRETDDSWRARIADELAASNRVVTRFMDHMAQGDEELKAALLKGRTEDAETQATRTFESTHERLREGLLEIVNDGDGSLLISADDSTKLLTQWKTAADRAGSTGDTSGLYETHITAERMKAEQARKTHEADLRKERETSKTREKKALEKAGVYDMDTGAATAGGGEQLSNRERMARAIEQRGGSITTV